MFWKYRRGKDNGPAQRALDTQELVQPGLDPKPYREKHIKEKQEAR